MSKYYYIPSGEKVEAKKVTDTYETIDTEFGKATIAKGNYIVTLENGNQFGVHADEFAAQYSKTKPKK